MNSEGHPRRPEKAKSGPQSSESKQSSPFRPGHLNKGPARLFYCATSSATLISQTQISATDRVILALLCAASVVIRLFRLGTPDAVVFDEVHFGGFAHKYFIGRFFLDVHPPLGKLLYTLVAFLAGYDGKFTFESIGDSYRGSGVPYVAMRAFPAFLGVVTVALCYLTLRASAVRPFFAVCAAALLAVDNAFVTESRLILLDAPLIFGAALAAYGLRKLRLVPQMSRAGLRFALLTAVGLGTALGVKWVGLFTLAWAVAVSVREIVVYVGDVAQPGRWVAAGVALRCMALFVVPLIIYIGLFAAHFLCGSNFGLGSSNLGPEFQKTLRHSLDYDKVPLKVAYGSEITLRHFEYPRGYLHSHNATYRTGSGLQQVTLYPHRDENNVWIVERETVADVAQLQTGPIQYVQNGDRLRLRHKATGKYLHAFDKYKPPVSEQDYQFEVCGFDNATDGAKHPVPQTDARIRKRKRIPDLGNEFDVFTIQISTPHAASEAAATELHAYASRFTLQHTETRCRLFSLGTPLPEWAFGQGEVTCNTKAPLKLSLWAVEENFHPMFGVAQSEAGNVAETTGATSDSAGNAAPPELEYSHVPAMPFWQKLLRVNEVMWRTNAGLTAPHPYESRPEAWPTAERGVSYFAQKGSLVYLLGNLPGWRAVLSCVAAYVVYVICGAAWLKVWLSRNTNSSIVAQLTDVDFGTNYHVKYLISGGEYLLGWAVHYLPFFAMQRQLFLHHYLPAVYFGYLLVGQTMEFCYSATEVGPNSGRIRRALGRGLHFAVAGVAVALPIAAGLFFYRYAALAYGTGWNVADCEASKLKPRWDYDCNLYA